MPIYEFICLKCNKKFTKLVSKTISGADNPKSCPFCSCKKIKKLISKFLFKKSLEDKLENLTEPSKIGDLNNVSNIRKWAKNVGEQMGDDLGENFEEEIEEEIEKNATKSSTENEEDLAE